MRRIMHWLSWELENEIRASGYFVVMLSCYFIVGCFYRKYEVHISTAIEMFLLSYVITFLHRLVLDEDKDYERSSIRKRGAALIVISSIMTILCCRGFAWFDDWSIYAELFLYLMLALAYVTVWLFDEIRRREDTNELNEWLHRYKEEEKE